jgi:hypothetical protein
MALNLVRNSKVLFTTNLDTAQNGYKVLSTGFTAANTYEVQVLDGFTFSQNTTNETVSIMEGGAAPTRGQRSFNTALAPVDFSFSTYLRPKFVTSQVNCEESVLWNALLTDQAYSTTPVTLGAVTGVTYAFSAGVGTVTIAGTAITGTLPSAGDIISIQGIATTTPTGYQDKLNVAGTVTGTPSATSITIALTNPILTTAAGTALASITATTLATATTVKYTKSAWSTALTGTSGTAYSYASSAASDKHQLQRFGMIFIVDQVAYAVDNAAMMQVSIDFGLDAIAMAAWTGQGTVLRQLATGATAVAGTFGNGLTGSYTPKVTDAGYITNKLSTVSMYLLNSLKDASATAQGAAGDAYTVPITGGSITINNNITYLTPANLGVVNTPVTYYTGARSISGNLTAYLRTGGTKDTGELLADMLLAASATIEPMATLTINIGGASTIKVAIELPAVVLQIPAVNVAQVVSTDIKFNAQGYIPSATADGNVYDLTKLNDFAVRYYA